VPPVSQVESKGVNCRSQWFYSPSYFKDSAGEWLPNAGVGLNELKTSLGKYKNPMQLNDVSCINGLLVGPDDYFKFEHRNIALPLAEDTNISSSDLSGYLFKSKSKTKETDGDLLGKINNTITFNMYYINSLFVSNSNNPDYTASLDYYFEGNQKSARYKTKIQSNLGYFRILYDDHLIGVISFSLGDSWLYNTPKQQAPKVPIFNDLKVVVNSVGKESEVSNLKILANASNLGEITKTKDYHDFYPENPSSILKLNVVLVCTNPDPEQVEACSGVSGAQCYVKCDSKNIPIN